MTTGIVARGLRRSFSDVHAVRDVSFEARPGRVTALVGPNGSGKTTLLLMLASLLRPDAGEIRISEVDPVADPAGVRKLIGWMPDTLGAWPALTVRETLVVTAKLYRLPAEQARRRAATLLDTVGLADLADAPARVLSRGQKQRLGLARALVHDPSVLLLDEPASGLDPEARIHLRTLLRGLAADGRTILISSHVLSELDELADDAVFMVRGETVSGDRVAAASTRSREWRIRIVGASLEEARHAVEAALPGSRTRVDRRDIVVSFASELDAARALNALVAGGVGVSEFAPVTGDLEHTFLDLGTRADSDTGTDPDTRREPDAGAGPDTRADPDADAVGDRA